MTATLEEPKAADDIQALCKYLAGKSHVPVEDLPKNLQSPATLARAVAKGYAEIGRRNHTEVIVSVTPKKEKNGSPVYDENFRQVVVKEMKTVHDNDWNWTNLRGPNRKPLADVLAEEKDMPEGIQLHIRLTTAGLAAS